MMPFIKRLILLSTILTLAACSKKPQTIPHYAISKIFKSDTLTTVNVHISSRMPAGDLLLIAGKLKTDSSQIQNLAIHFLLPGNADISMGDNSYYASARYIKESDVKPTDTLKDDNGSVFRIKVFGMSDAQAKHLLSLHPREIVGKNVMGKFIDDYNHTVIIPFDDPLDVKHEVYVIELDSAAKVVSATMPLKIKEGVIEKWQVTQNGDYITVKDSVLSQFGSQSFGVPFNSIKSGI